MGQKENEINVQNGNEEISNTDKIIRQEVTT